MDSLQTWVLALGTTILAVSGTAIAWRALRPSAEGGSIATWRDFVGLALTLGGLAALVAWLWASL